MRSLNEHLARRANEEDRCKGRVWEGRYKSQALLDDAAVLTCMSYVDLNPIRAGIAETPEDSDYTSIQQRIRAWQACHAKADEKGTTDQETRIRLMPLIKQSQDNHVHALGYSARHYIELVDWAGRAVRNDKRGAIATTYLRSYNDYLNPEAFLHHMQGRQNCLSTPAALGAKNRLKTLAARIKQKYFRGQSALHRRYQPALS